jgi:hypothetical protein
MTDTDNKLEQKKLNLQLRKVKWAFTSQNIEQHSKIKRTLPF